MSQACFKHAARRKSHQDDSQWISELKENPTYTGIDVVREYRQNAHLV